MDTRGSRNRFARFGRGATPVPCRAGDACHGVIANCFASVSLDPPPARAAIVRTVTAYAYLVVHACTFHALIADRLRLVQHVAGHPAEAAQTRLRHVVFS
jgi:flavin reductase (DIM6/NTAB) family NADH-FMN oxidoreductase RutF